VGTLGDMVAYSLYVAHIITTVEGGIVVTEREDFAETLRSLRAHGRACKCKECVINTGKGPCPKRFQYGRDIRFVFERVGYSAKMNELEAAVGLGSLEIFDEILAKRRENLSAMMQRIQSFQPYLTTYMQSPWEQIAPHALPILVAEEAPFTRDQLVCHLEQAGIDSRNLFASMPTQCAGFEFLGYKPGEFPNAEYVGRCGLHVGVHQDIGPAEIDYLSEMLEKFLAVNA